jgi:mRNA interferase MazF
MVKVKQGSIIKINLSPTIGSEQSGYRPALVVSNDFAISKTNIISVCPITNTEQSNFALNVPLGENTETKGTILCAHIRSVDLLKRDFKVIEQIPKAKLDEVLEVLVAMLETTE